MEVQGRVRGPRGQASPSSGDDRTTRRQTHTTESELVDSEAAIHGHFAGIGLPEEAGWYVSATLYWICGITILLIERFGGSDVIDPVIGLLALFLLACTPLLLLGAHFAPNAEWGPHVRILIPSVVLLIGSFVAGDAIGPLALLVMFPLLAVAFLHEWRIAVPYCVLSITFLIGALLVHDSSDVQLTRAIVLGGTFTAIVTALIFAQRRQRRIAAANHDLSVTDPLTGLANLRMLQTRLRQEIQRSKRAGTEVVMYAIDLDDFKSVNERFSYELGDNVLKAVATALADTMEPGDLLIRRGGDEFAVLTVTRTDRDADEFAAKIATAIERARRTVCPDVNPSASVTYVLHEHGEEPEDFLQRVDGALHGAKLEVHPERRDHKRAGFDSPPRSPHADRFAEHETATDPRSGSRVMPLHRQADARVAWRLVSAGSFIPAALLIVASIGGTAPDLSSERSVEMIAGMLFCGFGALLAGQLHLRLVLMHVPLMASLLLMTGVIAGADTSSMALIELYVIPTPLVVYLLGWRQALPYALLSGFFYAYFLLESDYAYAWLQIGMFVGIMAVVNVLLARGQRLTRMYLRSAEELSVVDPLTGASNLRGYHRRVAEEIDRCETLGDDLALMMIDLTDFKSVNDRYSHTMGDAVLVETASAIRSVVREDELIVRRGGDEFVVVCAPEASADMEHVANRIEQAISAARLGLTPDLDAGATVTAVHWRRGETAEELMARADDQLGAAKNERGRPVRDARDAAAF